MRTKTSTQSAVPDIVATLGTIGSCLFFGPFGLVTYPLFRHLTKKRVARDIDNIVAGDVSKVMGTWKNKRNLGENSIRVSKTIPFGGFRIPSTREYTLFLEDNE